jgi:hypothetical protein
MIWPYCLLLTANRPGQDFFRLATKNRFRLSDNAPPFDGSGWFAFVLP